MRNHNDNQPPKGRFRAQFKSAKGGSYNMGHTDTMLPCEEFRYSKSEQDSISDYLSGKVYAVIFGDFESYELYTIEQILEHINSKTDLSQLSSLSLQYAVILFIRDIFRSKVRFFGLNDINYLSTCNSVALNLPEYLGGATFNNKSGIDVMNAIFSHERSERKDKFDMFFGYGEHENSNIPICLDDLPIIDTSVYKCSIYDNHGKHYLLNKSEKKKFDKLLKTGGNFQEYLDRLWALCNTCK